MVSFERWAQFRHFRLAVAIDEHRSILHAANALGLSQPTASKLLQDLEEALNAPLFHRGNRGAEATELGRQFITHGRVILAQLRHASQSLNALAIGAEGSVVVGTLLAASADLLPTTIANLRARHPRIAVKIVEDTNDRLAPGLLSGELDIAIGRLSPHHLNDIEQEPLYEDDFCIVARRDHPLCGAQTPSLEELQQADWILPPRETVLRLNFEALFHDAGMNAPSPAIESLSYLSNRKLLVQTDLLGVWPQSLFDHDPGRDDLAAVSLSVDWPSAPIGISRRRGSLLPPAAEALIAELRATAKANSAVA